MASTTATTGKRPPTFDHLRSKKKPNTASVWIAMDQQFVDRYDEAKERLERAKVSLGGRSPGSRDHASAVAEFDQAEEAVKDTKRELEKNAVEFKFRSIGRRHYDDLVSEHPPTDKNRRQAEKLGGDPNELAFNTDTFPPALIAASLFQPELTEEQVQELFDSDNWSGNELSTLFLTALQANTQRKVVELGNA